MKIKLSIIILLLYSNLIFAAKKITDLPELTTPASADLLEIVDDVAGTPTSKKIEIGNLLSIEGIIDHINLLSTGTKTHATIDSELTALDTSTTTLQTSIDNLETSTSTLEGYIFDLWVDTASLRTDVDALIVSTGTFLTKSSATATYLQLSSATLTYLQNSSATVTYLQLSSATATYLTQSSATLTYWQTQGWEQYFSYSPFEVNVSTYLSYPAGVTPLVATHLVNKEYVDIAVMSLAFDLFLTSQTADLGSPYYVLLSSESGQAETDITSANLNAGADQWISSFTSTAGLPFDVLENGVYDGHFHLEKIGGAPKTVTLQWKLIHRDSGGTETILAVSEASSVITSKAAFDLHLNLSTVRQFSATDRVVIAMYANVTGGGAAAQIISYQEGLTDSHVDLRVESETLNNIFLRQDGIRPLTADWLAGDFEIDISTLSEVKAIESINNTALKIRGKNVSPIRLQIDGYADIVWEHASSPGGTYTEKFKYENFSDKLFAYVPLDISTITTTGNNEIYIPTHVVIVGNLGIGGEVTVGVNDTGHDVKFFGATSGKYLLWDESEDELNLTSADLTTTGTITSGDITIFDPTPILVFKDSNSLGAASVGFIEWRDSGGGRAGFLGNNSSGNDDLYWKNEQGGNIGIETTGGGKVQIFSNVDITGELEVSTITAPSGIGAVTFSTNTIITELLTIGTGNDATIPNNPGGLSDARAIIVSEVASQTVGYSLAIDEGSRKSRTKYFLTDGAGGSGAWGHWLTWNSGGSQPYYIGVDASTRLKIDTSGNFDFQAGNLDTTGSLDANTSVESASFTITGQYTLPIDSPTNDNDVPAYDLGTDAVIWQAQVGGSGSPGGADTQVQFYDSSSFGGNSGFVYNKTTEVVTVTSAAITTLITADSAVITNNITAGSITGGFTAGSAIFSDGSVLAEDNSNFFWDDANNRLAIGTNVTTTLNSPGLVIEGNGTLLCSIVTTKASASNSGAGITMGNDDGAAMGSGHRLGFLLFRGGDGTGSVPNATGVTAFTTELWDASGRGSELRFETVANNSTSRTKRLTITNSGDVEIHGDNKELIFGANSDASIEWNTTGDDNLVINPQKAGAGHYVVLKVPKASSGDPANPQEGQLYWNNTDNVIKMYADGGWRTLASW